MKRAIRSKEFDKNDLPSTRKEQFFDLFRHRFFFLLGLGVLFLLFFIPFFASIVYKDLAILSINQSEMDANDKAASLLFISLLFSFLAMLGLLIFSIGLSGVMKLLKQLIYDEPIFFKDDFLTGIKENYKSFLLLSFFAGLLNLISNVIGILFDNVLLLKIIFPALNFVLFYPVIFVAFFLASTYSNRLLVTLRSSLLIYIKHFPSVFLCFALVYGVSFYQYIDIMLLKYLLIVFTLLLYFPILLLSSYLNQIRIYDYLINKDQFPSYYLKGLSSFYQNEEKFK
ncbi:MAG TPA: hypothetical protein DEF61_05960 [Firmicutes bacterium]|nr:hypothetical protein [Bacillota bacterium]